MVNFNIILTYNTYEQQKHLVWMTNIFKTFVHEWENESYTLHFPGHVIFLFISTKN